MMTAQQLDALRSEPFDRCRLKAAIRIARTTQEQVATALHLTQSYISRIASNGSCRMDTARKLAAHFGCTVDDLFPAAAQAVA